MRTRHRRGSALLEYATVVGTVAATVAFVALAAFGEVGETYEEGAVAVEAAVGPSPVFQPSPVVQPSLPVLVPPLPPAPPTVGSFRFACFDEGMVSGGTIDVRSNNHFGPGFCLYAEEGIWMTNGNEFAYGSLVATPEYALLQTPPSGWNSNVGLLEAFQVIKLDVDVERTLLEAIHGVLSDGGAADLAYITDPSPFALADKKFDASKLRPGRVNTRLCKDGESLTIPRGMAIENLVFVTNCAVKFGQDVRVENAVLASTSSDAMAFHATHPLHVGRADACAPGGGAQLLTLGGAHFAAGLDVNGGQVVAVGEIAMAAQATGRGALLLSGRSVSGTSNIHMDFCGSGMDDNLVAQWWAEVVGFLSAHL